MGAFICRQPNGLICRFSSTVDCPTHWNMTEEKFIEWYIEQAREDAKRHLKNIYIPFEEILEEFLPNNMTQEEFDKFLEDVGYRKE